MQCRQGLWCVIKSEGAVSGRFEKALKEADSFNHNEDLMESGHSLKDVPSSGALKHPSQIIIATRWPF